MISPSDAHPLLIVIVNYRCAGLTLDCLSSLEQEVGALKGTRVEIVENASGDGSVERIRAAIDERGWGGWASIHPLEENGGFARGNNAAIGPALEADDPPRYVLLLNPDTVVRPGALGGLSRFMEAHPEVGIAGSRLEDPDGTPQTSSFRFHTVLSELDRGLCLGVVSRALSRWVVAPPIPEASCQVDWVAGASMIVREQVFRAVGLLDEGYFMYFEEVDLCLRARRAGWPCWYVPESRVVHLVGQSSGVTDPRAMGRRLPGYWFHARRRYFMRNHGPVTTVLADLAWLSGHAVDRLRRSVQTRPGVLPKNVIFDFFKYNYLLKK